MSSATDYKFRIYEKIFLHIQKFISAYTKKYLRRYKNLYAQIDSSQGV